MEESGERRRVLLVRHGETAFNAEGRLRGRADPELTLRGRLQADALAEGLAGAAPAEVIASPRRRATRTAEPIAQELGSDLELAADLDDIDYGHWTGLSRAEIVGQWPAEYALWLETPERLRIPGGERVVAVRNRVWAAVALAARERPTTVAVTHDVCIRMVICALLGAPLVAMHSICVDLTSVTEIAFDGEKELLVRTNDTSHLRTSPPERAPG